MQRIEFSRKDDVSFLGQLGLGYKAFKQLNPEIKARIPVDIKQKTKEVFDCGADIQEISVATGVATTTITRQVDSLKMKSKKSVVNKASLVQTLPLPSPLVLGQIPMKSIAEVSAQPREPDLTWIPRDWIKIRINGREIEVAKRDFWNLLQSKSGY